MNKAVPVLKPSDPYKCPVCQGPAVLIAGNSFCEVCNNAPTMLRKGNTVIANRMMYEVRFANPKTGEVRMQLVGVMPEAPAVPSPAEEEE